MSAERDLARYVRELDYDAIPDDVVLVAKQILLAVAGTAIAGAAEDGCPTLRGMMAEQGGRPEATVFVYGDRLPARSAALVNGTLCRALDYCDAMAPGLHIGSSLVPAAIAAAELRGGCDGREFIAALVAGAELSSRLNLTEAGYDGFDPTGVAGVFAATAAAARILQLDTERTAQALALAFNRCGGSFQSNVDGSLAVRLIQGWVAESGIACALLARAGLTGPARFLDGVYGYLKLYAKGGRSAHEVTAGLGETYLLRTTVFKKYPSCGLTQGATELALGMAGEGLRADAVESIEIRLPPYAHRLVGHEFQLGANPRVNAQFSAQFCVANALVRGASGLEHFREETIRDPAILALIRRIRVVPDPDMDARGHTAVDLHVTTKEGRNRRRGLDVAPGFPGHPLTQAQHRARFGDCLRYAALPLPAAQSDALSASIETLEREKDVCALVRFLVRAQA